MGSKSNSRRRFIMEYLSIEDETPDSYYVIVEIVDDIPVQSYIVKFPRPYVLFPFNLYLQN